MRALAGPRLWLSPSAFLVAMIALITAASAQPTPGSTQPVPTPDGEVSSMWALVVVLGGVILAIVLSAKFVDRWRGARRKPSRLSRSSLTRSCAILN